MIEFPVPSEEEAAHLYARSVSRIATGSSLSDSFYAASAEAFGKMIEEIRKDAWRQGFRDGWMATGEGHNAEYPDEGKTWPNTKGYQVMQKIEAGK